MTRTLLVLTTFALLAAGCGKNKAVKATEDLADEVCACKDVQCAMDAAKRGTEKLMGMMDEKGTESDVDAIKAATKRMQDCMRDIAKK
jgi:hypothetical protein